MGENDSFRLIDAERASMFLVILAFVGFVFYAHEVRAGDFYIGSGIGQSHMTKTTCPDGFICEYRVQGWKAFAGYRINRNVSIEGAWVDLGRSDRLTLSTASDFEFGRKGTHGLATARGPTLSVLGFFPLSSRFSVYAGAGLQALKVRNEVVGRPDRVTVFQTNTEGTSLGPVWSFGAEYDLTKRFSLRAEFSHFHRVGGSTIGGLTEKELAVLSAGYSFK